MTRQPAQTTAAQEILLAADDLARSGREVFTEWDLTVAAWKRNNSRFGCRGYEDEYPDHKRVMMEIMGQSKADNPVRRRFLEKVRTNYYQITALGRAEADRLRQVINPSADEVRSPGPVFTAVEPYATDRIFRTWLADPQEPRTWLGATAFLRLSKNNANELNDRIRAAETAVRRGIEWCNDNGRDILTRGTHGGGAISRAELLKLQEFIGVLQERFATQIGAIRQKGT
jgi:DNA-binding PadR family transcriptional regulator